MHEVGMRMMRDGHDSRGRAVAGVAVGSVLLLLLAAGLGPGPAAVRASGVDQQSFADPPTSPRSIAEVSNAAQGGDVEAMQDLGQRYLEGTGVPKDRTAGRMWLEKAAATGNLEAMADYGRRLRNNFEYLYEDDETAQREAIPWLRRAAEAGHHAAMRNLGQMLVRGEGVASNPVEARAIFTRGVAVGAKGCLFELAEMCRLGLGGPREPGKAVELYEKASVGGDAKAQTALAKMLLTGDGAPKEPHRAISLLTAAAKKDHHAAQWLLSCCYATGSGVHRDEAAAIRWLQKAARSESDVPEAKLALARMLLDGRSLPIDRPLAYTLLTEVSGDAFGFGDGDTEVGEKARTLLQELKPQMTADERERADQLGNVRNPF